MSPQNSSMPAKASGSQSTLASERVSPLPLQLLLPMSGQGTRFQAVGYSVPKPLIPVNGVPMIQRLLDVFPSRWQTHAVVAENHLQTQLPDFLRENRPGIEITSVAAHKRGPGFAIFDLLETLPAEAPVLVSYCDYGMKWDPNDFERFVRSSGCDACVVSYRGFHAHYLNPLTYAFSRMDGECVKEVKEKGSFTDNRENEFASNGAYYFRSVKLLREALSYQMEKGIEHGGELYLSLTTEALLRMNPKSHVRVYEIPAFYQWGTPADLQTFEFFERSFLKWNSFQGQLNQQGFDVASVLMPMAGQGSRFRSLSPVAKPFLSVGGQPMFEKARLSLPRAADKNVFVALEEHRSDFDACAEAGAAPDASVAWLAQTPEGQALSTEAGVPLLPERGDIVVSACDHAIVLDPSRYQRFRAQPDCDAAIFTVTGFPGGARTPESYAWVKVDEGDESEFPLVSEVSVKKPVSETPLQDRLLVGTFWFAQREVLAQGIAALKEADVRVKGELYLDSVFSLLQKLGMRVRVIDLDGYVGWGDPDALAESLYWQEVFFGHGLVPRPRFPGVAQHVEV